MFLTGQPADIGMMDVMNLRGVGTTAPYFHNNSAATLEEVLEHCEAFFRRVARVNRPPRLPAIQSSDGVTIAASLRSMSGRHCGCTCGS